MLKSSVSLTALRRAESANAIPSVRKSSDPQQSRKSLGYALIVIHIFTKINKNSARAERLREDHDKTQRQSFRSQNQDIP
jgi:CRISPR/Cas system type I-B associated protein Csh2 (Cas7 group RAMP superfamily)